MIKVAEGILEGQEVFTGFAGQYLTAPVGTDYHVFSLYEIVHEAEDGTLTHLDFWFMPEEADE